MTKKRCYPPELREQAALLRDDGMSVTQICLDLDVNYTTLRKWLHEDRMCDLCLGSIEAGEWRRCRYCRERYGISQHQPGDRLYAS